MKNTSVFFSNSSKLQCQELLYLTDVEIHNNYPASWLEIDKFADKKSVCEKRLFYKQSYWVWNPWQQRIHSQL